ncbi:hypothetical protein HPP92_017308 [Vanilla planifolia]|uniref:Uncharacterized protein n=1 Tax=Vanilla planifolia TaxID=51239 RepID=A0A835UPI5_VANPL|nr:hypothetical protein HPP92_017308 [Vanilla planifolia]
MAACFRLRYGACWTRVEDAEMWEAGKELNHLNKGASWLNCTKNAVQFSLHEFDGKSPTNSELFFLINWILHYRRATIAPRIRKAHVDPTRDRTVPYATSPRHLPTPPSANRAKGPSEANRGM